MTADVRSAAAGDTDTTPHPLQTFLEALPAHAREVLPADDRRVLRAVAVLAGRGVDLADVAATCGSGTAGRTTDDQHRLALYRLLRAADLLEVRP